jgi:DNA mismatch repair protein MutL
VSDVIHLLPDSVANQIAAGEVIQRPSSVVKELVENALDAGAGEIVIHIKDAGKTLIQVSDNGCGMSSTDARMAFERHATSKIHVAGDLFAIKTFGFRGEALASVAAIADIEMRTKKQEDETGTFLHISATKVIAHEAAGCANGTTIQVKNLFFNVPARRKFLKSDPYELKNIVTEVTRVAIPNPEISFQLYHNNSLIHDLPASNTRKRIVSIFGKSFHQSLIPVESKTSVISISGFIGLPRFARKTMGEQFFFVNRRYMRHPWFHKAVMQAYEKLLPPDAFPSYFIFLETDPSSIDINVHPTKTEIKFENENAVWQLLNATVRESLGKNNVVPSIDFDQGGSIEIPLPPKPGSQVIAPDIPFNPRYNPFETTHALQGYREDRFPEEKKNLANWEILFRKTGDEAMPNNDSSDEEQTIFPENTLPVAGKKIFQLRQKYLVLPVKSGLMVIDQRRGQERILFEKFMDLLNSDKTSSQQLLYPFTFELNPPDAGLLSEILPELQLLGFDIREFGRDTFVINGIPAIVKTSSPAAIIEKMLEEFRNSPVTASGLLREQAAMMLARAASMSYRTELQPGEMEELVDQLFACSLPNFTADGKKVLMIIPFEEIEKNFKK